MKYCNFLYVILTATIFTSYSIHAMEPISESKKDNSVIIQNKILYLKESNSCKRYNPIIQNLESKLSSSISNKIDIVDYGLQMICLEDIDGIINTITKDYKTNLHHKIFILKNLYNLTNLFLYQQNKTSKNALLLTREELREEKPIIAYWLNSKAAIDENLSIKTKHYAYEKQKTILEYKLNHNKKISLEEWKSYQLLLFEYNKIINDILTKQEIKLAIKETKNIIEIEEAKLDLKSIVFDIRHSEADIDELSAYKKKLEKYIQLLSESYLHEVIMPQYNETIEFLSKRINLLNKIDTHLSVDLDFYIKGSTETIEYLHYLQNQLNKPNSQRHKKLTEKIQLIKELTKK